MKQTSKTGLLASPTKKVKIIRKNCPKKEDISDLRALVGPAPFNLKPFAGLYNPYSHGCSLLCNHPSNSDSKELVKRAKNTWASEGKNILLVEDIEAVRNNFQRLKLNPSENNYNYCYIENDEDITTTIDSVPEELFRRYTETDSRPLTPAPTLVSAYTRASGSRRCITPDPISSANVKEKTMLILDLRRSHSQETLSWYGSSVYYDTPLIKIFRAPLTDAGGGSSVRSTTRSLTDDRRKFGKIRQKAVERQNNFRHKNENENDTLTAREQTDENSDDNVEPLRRRGKKKRIKKRKGSSKELPPFQNSVDPETQVSAIGQDSNKQSKSPSVQLDEIDKDDLLIPEHLRDSSFDFDLFLDKHMVKYLRRQLSEEDVEYELNSKKRKALLKALKIMDRKKKNESEKLKKLKKELNLPPSNAEFILSLPRIFSRRSARFELPMDSRTLSTLAPLRYVREYVIISDHRKLLYKCIFNKYWEYNELHENNRKKLISGNQILQGLCDVMSVNLSEEKLANIRDFLKLGLNDKYDFLTFTGVCAVCERIMPQEFGSALPPIEEDPFDELEKVDFESLPSRLEGQDPSENLLKILYAIKDN